ncbi:MAG: Polysaccharide lyase family 1 [Bacteroidota bacterium]
MKFKTLLFKHVPKAIIFCGLALSSGNANSQTLAFPEAQGFGKYTTGARAVASPKIYLVTNLNDSGPGSFRDAVSQEGRFVIFKVGGIINTLSQIVVAKNTTIAGQTATGEGIVLLGAKVTFTGSSNTIARYLRIRYGSTTQGQDASGLANGANMIFDHMAFTWGTDEVFSINWDSKGTSPDNITIQNSIIGQGLHRHNHSAGGLMQPSGGKISLIGNLYICNKTRNNKIKGINEFVNNVVYNWGNYGNTYGHAESGDAYIMGGDSAGSSDVNIINNYFIGGPNTSTSVTTPFNRGNDNFSLYGAGNYFDNNRNGILDGTLVPQDLSGYPTGDASTIHSTPYDYPMKNTTLSAQDAYDKIVAGVGPSYPRRDQVDNLMISDLKSKGTVATYLYVQTDLTSKFGFINGGAGHVYGAPSPLDTDNDGMPDAWEDSNGLNKNNANDAVAYSTTSPEYLNIEVYINGLINTVPPEFVIPPTSITFNATSVETPTPSSKVILAWKDNSDNETNFVIERSIDGTNYTQIAQVAANTTTYSDNNLVPNTKYYYRIKATTTTESSSYSDVNSLTTPAIPSAPTKAATPTPTTGMNTVDLVNGTLALKWTGSANTTTYSVYFGTDPANLTKLGDIAYVAAPSYTLTSLSPATIYYWRIDATNAKGTVTGDVWNFSAQKAELVGHWPFKEVAGEGEQIADISAYANDGQLDAAFDKATVRVAGKANNAIDFSTFLPNKQMVTIPHQDNLLFDKNSFSVSFWMKADASQLPATSTLSSYILCKGSITKNTTTGATGKRFDVEIKNNQFRFAIDDDKVKTELTSTLAATKYYTGDWVHVVIMRDVTAKKLKLYTNGVFTNELADGTGTAVGIGEPTDLVVGNIGVLELYANTTPAPYKGKIDELKIFNYALSASEIAAIYNTTLINSPSNVTFETNIVPIPAPSSIVTLKWNDNSNNEANFAIERSSDGNSFVQIAEVGANTTTYTDTNLAANTKYYYRLKATNKTDSSAYSEVFNVTTPTDDDNDGYSKTNDCNDNDVTVHVPIQYYVDADKDGFGSTETAMLCSSVATEGYSTNNNDCNDNDATVHEPILYYVDTDKDGFGSTETAMLCSSTAPEGYAKNNTDCNDNDVTVHEPILYYVDTDKDGFGSTETAMFCSSTAPEGYATNNTDCNDNDATVHEPILYYVDADKDGFGSTETAMFCSSIAPEGYATNNTDCNDNDATVHEPILYYVDADKDGFGSTVTAMLCSSVAPEGYATNNSDCDDSKILYADNDGDKLGSGAPIACGVENNDDCDDSNAIPLTTSIPDVYAISSTQEKNTIYVGYGSSLLPIKVIPTGGTAPYSYIWNTNQTTQTISIATAGIYTVIITDAKGCQTSASIDVNAINVQCGNSGDKVMVCHNGQETCISSNAVQAHLNHGDKLGSCNNTPAASITENVTVFPNPVVTILNVKVDKVYDGAELALYNILASKVKSEPLTSTMQQMFMSDLNKGIYFLHVKNGKHYTIKAIVKK